MVQFQLLSAFDLKLKKTHTELFWFTSNSVAKHDIDQITTYIKYELRWSITPGISLNQKVIE